MTPKQAHIHRAYAETLRATQRGAETHLAQDRSRTVHLDEDQLKHIIEMVTAEVVKRMLPLLGLSQASPNQEPGIGHTSSSLPRTFQFQNGRH